MTLRTVEIRIAGRPPTPNNHTKATGYQFALSRRWKETAEKAAKETIGEEFQPIRAANIDVIFVVPDARDRDWDNLIASTKPLTDGLVAAGVLVGDSQRVIRRIAFPEIRLERGLQATIYRITELDAGPELGL